MTDVRMKSNMSPEDGTTPQSWEDKCIDVLRACRGSRKLVILIVAIALLLDNMLLTSVGSYSISLEILDDLLTLFSNH